VDLFKKMYGSTISVEPQSNPGGSALIAAIAAGTQPDLVNTNAAGMAGLILQGALTPIKNSVYQYNHILPWQNFFAGDAVDPFSMNNEIYGVPFETDGAIGLVANVPVDAVKKLGLEKQYPPTNGQTYFQSYEQLYALAKALQVTQNGKVKRWGLCGEGWDFETMSVCMNTMGVPPFDIANERFNFNTPAGIRAMQYHVEIPVKMGIEKEWSDASADIDEGLNGNAAITLGNADVDLEGIKYGYDYVGAGMPIIDGHEPVGVGTGVGWGMVGPIKPQHPNLQLAFLRMSATAQGQYQFDLTYGGVPVVAWKDFTEHDTSRFHPANSTNGFYVLATAPYFKRSLLSCKYVGRLGYNDKVSSFTFAACQAVRLGKMTSAQAMAKLQQQCEAQYKQYKIDLENLQ
jgi:ABC-type glycerol-3-phosphate transport system substrate-binding protein